MYLSLLDVCSTYVRQSRIQTHLVTRYQNRRQFVFSSCNAIAFSPCATPFLKELVKFHDSVRRRESKQQKRQERKQKHLELRKKLTRGAFSDGTEGLGTDPDLFSLRADTTELLESEEKYVDASLLLTGGEDEQEDFMSGPSPWRKSAPETDGKKTPPKRREAGVDDEEEEEWNTLEHDEDLDDIDR